MDGRFVSEAARDYLTERKGEYTKEDLPKIWAKQQEAEDAARASSASFVVCDTGPEVIRIWAEVKFGSCPQDIVNATNARHYDLVLLCMPDLPWVFDELREAPDLADRAALLERYRSAVGDGNFHEIHGEARLAQALRIVLAAR